MFQLPSKLAAPRAGRSSNSPPPRSKLAWRAAIGLGTIVALACLLFAPPAGAARITGISDENLNEWDAQAWSTFEATGLDQVRKTVRWDIAVPGAHPSELATLHEWVDEAQLLHRLNVLISFNHPATDCLEKKTCNSTEPPLVGDYLNAVGNFRKEFKQIAYYTAWNEPNHHVAPKSNSKENMNPTGEEAGEYFVNMNFACHLPEAQYGPNCTVVGGDFLEANDGVGKGLTEYMAAYKKALARSSVSPSAWAIHPYSSAELGSSNWGAIDNGFLPFTENKPIWFTEVGGMVCRPGQGHTGTGPSPHNLQEAEIYQNQSINNLLALMNHLGSRLHRTYYYSLSAGNGGEPPCPIPSSNPPDYRWDSDLLAAGDRPRAGFLTLFPELKPQADAAVTEVGEQQAKLLGFINPRGLHTTYRFEYGIDWGDAPWWPGGYEYKIPVPDGDVGGGNSTQIIAQVPTNLIPGFPYHYRIVATNADGTTEGAEKFFETDPPPVAPPVSPATFSSSIGTLGSGNGQLKWPADVEVDPQAATSGWPTRPTAGSRRSTPKANT